MANSMNNLNDIFTRQNTETFLLRLRAQGRTYDRAKNYSNIVVFTSVILTIAFSVLGNLYPDCTALQCLSVIFGAFSAILCCFLEYVRKSRKSLAARIQQLIDSELFDMTWELPWGDKPTLDEIQKAAEDESEDRYINWYDSAINRVNKLAAITMCFRININYDAGLRQRFMTFLHIVFWMFIALIIIISYIGHFAFDNVIYFGFIPALPFILWYANTWHNEVEDTDNLRNLRALVDDIQNQLVAGVSLEQKTLVDIQTLILQHRSSCFDIPSCLYKKFRTKNEQTISEFANNLADELLRNPSLANV